MFTTTKEEKFQITISGPINPPTLQQLKVRIKEGDTTFISKIQHFSAKIRGSPAYWRLQRQHLTTWMYYHAAHKHGPPTLFMTFSCAENHWGDLAKILADRVAAYHSLKADQLRQRNFKAMCEAARDHPLIVAEFFQRSVVFKIMPKMCLEAWP